MSYDALKAEIREQLQEDLRDKDKLERLKSIQRSPTWRRIEEFLAFRREQLYTESPTTTEALWKREGALAEIQALLRRGPMLVLQWEQWKSSAKEQATPATSPADFTTDTDDGLG